MLKPEVDLKGAAACLMKLYGPQGWWPRLVLERGDLGVRHAAGDALRWVVTGEAEQAFEVALGAILTQNTAWANVEKALIALAERGLLSSRTILAADEDELQAAIRPAGYFRQKARKLRGLSSWVERDLGGDLRTVLEGQNPRQEILRRWGIGPETADTILLYALNQPSFVVDAYTRRWLCTLTGEAMGLKMPYEDVQEFCAASLPGTVREWQEAHALIVAWGKSQ